MVVSDEDDDWNSVSGDDDGDVQRCDDEVVNLETSPSGVSVKSFFLLPERNEENTDWLSLWVFWLERIERACRDLVDFLSLPV
jgi:hypothetical protein